MLKSEIGASFLDFLERIFHIALVPTAIEIIESNSSPPPFVSFFLWAQQPSKNLFCVSI